MHTLSPQKIDANHMLTIFINGDSKHLPQPEYKQDRIALVYRGCLAVVCFSKEDNLYYCDIDNSQHTILSEGSDIPALRRDFKDNVDYMLDKFFHTKLQGDLIATQSEVDALYKMLVDLSHVSNLLNAPPLTESYNPATGVYYKNIGTFWCKDAECWKDFHRPMDHDLYLTTWDVPPLLKVASLLDTADRDSIKIKEIQTEFSPPDEMRAALRFPKG